MLVPAHAHAGNGVHERTPVAWNDIPCATVVDKAATPTFHVDYGIPYEDTDVTADEVADSRRHQFMAMCADNSPQDFLPTWITWDDVDAAAAVDLVDPATVDPDRVMEDAASGWSDCFHRINGDDARLPITFANADAGVNWDLAAVPAGVYVIQGYTWEPPYNIWSQRPGYLKVVDGDPASAGPAAAFVSTNPEEDFVVYSDEIQPLEGCVDAEDGATMTVEWATTDESPTWGTVVADEPVSGTGFLVDFAAPEGAHGESVMFRVVVSEPDGDEYVAFMRELVIVLEGSDPNACTNGGSFLNDPGCADSGGSDSGSGDGTRGDTTGGGDTAATTGPMLDDGGDDGGGTCACRSGAPTPAPWLMLGGLGLLGLRRRRS
jgi:MYXO-CTERM domain-containing protein